MSTLVQEVAALDARRFPGTELNPKVNTLSDYSASQAAAGLHVHPGTSGTWWLQYETGTYMRFPIFAVSPPTAEELRQLYWRRFAPLVTYLLEPTPTHPADAVVYVCTNVQYKLRDLDHGVQGNVKRGLRECQIRPITQDEVIRFGEQAFADTWRRHGWENVSSVDFKKCLSRPATHGGNRFFGAWRDGELLAFAGLIEADDWVEVRVRFSTDASLRLRPNDALLFYILNHYLVERGFRLVSAGTSSIDPTANTPGLHRFKVKLGFRAVPVRRLFCFHPLLRVFVCRVSLALLDAAASRFKRNPRFVLAQHAVRHSLGRSQPLPTDDGEGIEQKSEILKRDAMSRGTVAAGVKVPPL